MLNYGKNKSFRNKYFVEYYGEKYRDRITQKLNDAFYIFAAQIHSDTSVYKNFDASLKTLLNEYTTQLLKSCGASNTKEIDYKDLLEIVQAKSFKNVNKELVLKLIKSFYENSSKSPEQLADDAQTNQKLDIYFVNIKKEFNKKYKKYFAKIASDKKIVQKLDIELNDKKAKYESAIDQFLLDEIKEIRKINKKNDDEEDVEKYIDTLRNLYNLGETEFLENNELDFVNKLYIEFFNVLGFDYGENIDDYKNNFMFKAVLFNRQSIQAYKNLVKQNEFKLIFSSPIFYNALEKIKTINTDTYLKRQYSQKVYRFILGNDIAFVKTHPGDSKKAVCCVCRDYFHASDEDIIHEMNHIIETDHIRTADDEIDEYKCGFYYSGYYEKAVEDIEMLNEVVNEYLTVQVAKILHKNSTCTKD